MRSRFLCGRAMRRLPCTFALAALAAVVAPSQQAAAQSLFEALFGSSKPSRPHPQALPQYAARPLPPAPRASSAPASGAVGHSVAVRDHDDGTGSGSYRTVCVRLCDGYYWPISHNVSRGRLNRDANTCRSSCGEEARLFYMPARTSDIDDAVDLQGRRYPKLSTAFLYRKRLVDGCACRPAPWSDLEAARHNQYLMAELASRPRHAGTEDAPPQGPRVSARSAQDIGTDPVTVAVARAQTVPPADGGIEDAPEPRIVSPPLVEQPAALADAQPSRPAAQVPRPGRTPRRETARTQAQAQVQPQLINRRPGTARQPAQAVQPVQTAQAKPPMSPGMFSGLGGPQKYTWPGDPVRR